jgi:hypothetical protein
LRSAKARASGGLVVKNVTGWQTFVGARRGTLDKPRT